MDIVPISDDEREDGEICSDDGEIVDEFEDISDYSIPSCGKSDLNQDLLRAISLSSISDSDGIREHGTKHYIPARKRTKNRNSHHRSKRKRKRDDPSYLRSKHRLRTYSSSSNSSETDSDIEKINKTTLQQLQTAIRISSSTEKSTNPLQARLKKMIDPECHDPEDEDEDALRALALLTSKKSDNDKDNKDDQLSAVTNFDDNDIYTDKELAELRLEALKSAVMKKHLERKKRKENIISTNAHHNTESNDKENAENNIINNSETKNEENFKTDNAVVATVVTNDDKNVSIEEDLDVMRAMLLASMSKKITSVTNNTTTSNNNSVQSQPHNQIQNAPKSLSIKNLAVLGPTTKLTAAAIKIPSVKPLIINLNSDTDSDDDDDAEIECNNSRSKPANNVSNNNPIDVTVTEFLKKQREQFEAKQAKVNITDTTSKSTNKNLLDKSVLKLLSKSQQQEYQLLKQKLLLANKRKRTRRLSLKVKANEKVVPKPTGEDVSNLGSNNNRKPIEELALHKDGRRLQMKGKYKELVPLIQKVNIASQKRKMCEEHINKLLTELKTARTEYTASIRSYTELVKKLRQAKDTIDQRLPNKFANAISTVNNNTPKKVEVVKSSAPTATIVENGQVQVETATMKDIPKDGDDDDDALVQQVQHEEAAKVEEVIVQNSKDYVSPLDNLHRNNKKSNPLNMLCPYELFGVCKDQDCNFNHCP